ncbi:MAG: FTR1 family protein [Dehalococcoidia bacterium]
MLFSFLVTLREGFEIALIIAIVLGYLARTGNRQAFGPVWAGVGIAALVTVAASGALVVGIAEASASAQEAFEGVTMLLAVGVLTWMVLWMKRQAASIGGDLRAGVDVALRRGSLWAMVGLAFSAVIREGIETALFLVAGASAATDSGVAFIGGGVAGFAVAAVLGYGIYRGSHLLPIRQFFTVSGIVVIVLAAGLLSNGLMELQESALIPTLGGRPWDTDGLLSMTTTLGRLAHTLIGYDSAPTWGQIVAYWTYLLGGIAAFTLVRVRVPGRAPTPKSNAAVGRS